jgi:1,4-dihydroxy-2-naphthoate octaprenyltransferase
MTKNILGPMRLPFLILGPACALLGIATAVWQVGPVSVFYSVLAVLGAVTAHISVNAFNEYFDFKSGLDFKTKATPFSGGSGTLPANPQAARPALMTAWISFALTGAIGLYFLWVWGLALLPLGLLGLAVVYIYTNWITRSPLLCLIAPGLGFGILTVMGTYFVLTGQYSLTAFFASLVPFFLVNNLLLLNQFPDADADKSIGRKHYPIAIGRQQSSLIFAAFLALAYLSLIIGVVLGYLPPLSLLGLLTVFLAVPLARGAYTHADDIPALIPFLGQNVIINIATPLLMAAGLFFS